jgi:hypothetical protein
LVATPDVTALQRSDLNNFLFADVGTEANGMTLCMLSVFARLGSDPWSEAGRLADLPKREATDSIAHTIAEMPTSLWKLADADVIAARLTRLLPIRPARGQRGPVTFTVGWQPSAKARCGRVRCACPRLRHFGDGARHPHQVRRQ